MNSEEIKERQNHKLNLLINEGKFYVIYTHDVPQYEYIKREYEQQKAEKEAPESQCEICHEGIVPIDNYKCKGEDCAARFHKRCLINHHKNLRTINPQSNEKSVKCPNCGIPIPLKEIMTKEEYDGYKERFLGGDHGGPQRSPPRGDPNSVGPIEEYTCVLCGKTFILHESIEEIFNHKSYDKGCQGKYVHKECLRKVLSIWFWHKFERYNGESILLLTKAEEKVLGKHWACPQCNNPLTEDQLRMLVDLGEWTRQKEMRDMRDRETKSRYPIGGPYPLYMDCKYFLNISGS